MKFTGTITNSDGSYGYIDVEGDSYEEAAVPTTERVRSAVGELEGVADPLPQAMDLLYGELEERTDERLAAQFITGLISRTSAEDNGVVIRNILMS